MTAVGSHGAVIEGLRSIVGAAHVLIDADQRAGYEVDWTRRFGGESLAVVRPSSTDEVVAVVHLCRSSRVDVVPQGGNTGLVGGSVPHRAAGGLTDQGPHARPCIVVSTQRLTSIREVDTVSGQVTVEAGVTLAALEEALFGSGWEFGVDLGARESATIGGMVSTNAGGTRVLRHGSMRANLLGVEAVLGSGDSVVHLEGLVKDNTGYDLAGLLCGSEGTLGIVTAARLRLVPAVPDRLCVAIACSGWAEAVELASRALRTIGGLDGLEAIEAGGARVAERELGIAPPLVHDGVTLFVVWAGRGDPPAALGELVADRASVAGAPRRVMEVRERQTEAIARTGIPHKFDVTLPMSALAAFTDEIRREVDSEAQLFLFGHLGDGNLHVNIVGPEPGDQRVDDLVLRTVARYGGSISAEHGIGRAKAPWLHLSRSASEIAAMRAIKAALDPDSIMNPGVLLES